MKTTIGNLIDEMQRQLNFNDDDFIDDSSELLSPKEVAEYLGMHIGTIYKLIGSGMLKAYNLSCGDRKTYDRVKRVDLENYLEERYCVW